MRVDFYFLTVLPLERVLPRICERLLEEGQRLLIVAGDPLLEQLDRHLWTYAPDAFLPHGRSQSAAPEDQPVLLSGEMAPLNGATNLAIADGRWRDGALDFARTFYFFDEASRADARNVWRDLKDVEKLYWKQDERGKWVQGP